MKKIYLLPNFITLCNLLCGYWSITFALKGSFAQAAIMIYFSLLFDTLDGSIARLTNTTSRFGLELDSLSDVVSFGVAPACLVYQFFAGDPSMEKLSWWACFLFIVCGTLRLARYNVQSNNEEKHDFVGLPIPCGAGFIASYVLFQVRGGGLPFDSWLLFIVIVLAMLMVSSMRYPSLGRLNLKKRNHFDYLVAAVVVLGLLVRFPQQAFLCLFVLYILIGPIWAFKDVVIRKAIALKP